MEISIQKPCHENWDSFTPNEQGAFCGKCAKTVIDFSNKSIEEIKAYFTAKQDEKVCGRFEKTQLTSLSFDAFFNEFKGFNFTKRFAVILYFTFGMWLFNSSSSSAQTTIHEKGDVQVVNPILGGVRAIPQKQDSVKPTVKPHTRPQKTSVKGKVKCVEQKPIENQKIGEVMVVPEKKKTTANSKTKNK